MAIQHKITNSEIKYGILLLSKNSIDFFANLPESFTMIVNDNTLYERKFSHSNRRIWIGYTIMREFNPNQIVNITVENNRVIVK